MLTAVLLLAGTAARAQERGANQNDLTFAVTAGYNASDGSSWTCGAST